MINIQHKRQTHAKKKELSNFSARARRLVYPIQLLFFTPTVYRYIYIYIYIYTYIYTYIYMYPIVSHYIFIIILTSFHIVHIVHDYLSPIYIYIYIYNPLIVYSIDIPILRTIIYIYIYKNPINTILLYPILPIDTMWGPPVISWFRFAPVTIVICAP